jgi:CTP synthase (UTP-ammonia lyase)
MNIVALGDRDPKYLTHREIDATLELLTPQVDAGWVATDQVATGELEGAAGVWLFPGTPYRDEDAAVAAIRFCLETGTAFLATCGGFQYTCIELARRVGVIRAAHAESGDDSEDLVVVPLSCQLYGERRLVRPVAGTRLVEVCGAEPFEGFHWCGYGLAERYVERLVAGGIVVSATAADIGVEAIELPQHPFFIATAFQPQVGTSETKRVHPLIAAFVEAAIGPRLTIPS